MELAPLLGAITINNSAEVLFNQLRRLKRQFRLAPREEAVNAPLPILSPRAVDRRHPRILTPYVQDDLICKVVG